MKTFEVTTKWDKVFAKSDKVDHKKVSFKNRYGITLIADLYKPKGVSEKLPAIAFPVPSVPSRNRFQDYMHRPLQRWDF